MLMDPITCHSCSIQLSRAALLKIRPPLTADTSIGVTANRLLVTFARESVCFLVGALQGRMQLQASFNAAQVESTIALLSTDIGLTCFQIVSKT